jgi:hypothetical protein
MRNDAASCCCGWRTWASRTRSRCCGCCLAATATRTSRFCRCGISLRCCSANSTGSRSGSSRSIGRGWPRCCTRCHGRPCGVCGCWSGPTRSSSGHRDLIARRHAAASRPGRRGRPRTLRSIRALVLRLARENSGWGYRRLHGELLTLGIKVAPSTVWEILREAGSTLHPTGPPPPGPTSCVPRPTRCWLRTSSRP